MVTKYYEPKGGNSKGELNQTVNSTTFNDMLEQLIQYTESEKYKEEGGMRVNEILVKPWDSPEAKFTLEAWDSEEDNTAPAIWEITCASLAQLKGIPQAISPRTRLKLYDAHPLLWPMDDQVYFSTTGAPENINALMGELFIEHSKICGNWIDFHQLYDSLPTTFETQRENQLSLPIGLKAGCFSVLEKHGVRCDITTFEQTDNRYQVLFFSNSEIWPDEENFNQPYIIGEEFSAKRIA